jgi:hypothetical protein
MSIFAQRFSQLVINFTVVFALLAFSSAFAQPPSSTWTQLNPSNHPSARDSMVMVYDPVSQKTILFGGWDGSKHLNDTWTFDGKNWREIHVMCPPPARAGAGAVYDSQLKRVVLFGGFNGHYLDDTWLWNGATSTWTKTTPADRPPAETGPMLFPDPLNGRADEFGGYDGKFFKLGTWSWWNDDWHLLPFEGSASGRAGAVIGTDPVTKQTVVFGGIGDINPNNTWTFDGDAWTLQHPATQPSSSELAFAGSAYDPRFNGVVIFGGFNGALENETWVWSENDWIQLSPEQAPPPRQQMGMAFDELHQRTVVFGGANNKELLNDTWVLETTSK